MSRRKPTLLTAVILPLISILIYYGQQNGWFSSVNQAVQTSQPGLYRVTRFSDGDTIAVNMNGHNETVRMIGVDTPETHKPNTPVQCYGPAASAYTKNLIGNKPLRLELDSLSTNRDRYDRLLRYVYLPDGTLVNQRIIENGYGFYYPHFPFTKSRQFASAQKLAQTGNKGLWANCRPELTTNGGYISNPL